VNCQRGVESSEVWKETLSARDHAPQGQQGCVGAASVCPLVYPHRHLPCRNQVFSSSNPWGPVWLPAKLIRASRSELVAIKQQQISGEAVFERTYFVQAKKVTEETAAGAGPGTEPGEVLLVEGVEGPAGSVSAVQPTGLDDGESVCSVLGSPPLRPIPTPG